MDEEIKFKRSIFEKHPWLNFAMTIIVTLLQITTAIVDYFRGNYFWTVFFILMALIYLFLMIPMSYKMMRRTIQRERELKDLEKRINKIRKEWKE